MRYFMIFTIVMVAKLAFAQGAPDVAAGKAKFQAMCASCHGTSGKGDSAAAAAFNPKPRNFADAAYMKTRSDAVLKSAIMNGGAAVGKSASMPPWKASLKDQDATNIVAYIRTLAK